MLCNPDCWLSFERTRAYVDIWQLTGQGPHFTNGFSIAVQIQWIFHFTLTSVVSKWSLQTFQHDTTALLSWHVHKICCNLMTSNGITARRIFHRISIVGKKSLLKWAPECVVEIVLKLWILVIIYRTLPLSYEVQSFEAITLLKSRGVKFPMNVDRDRKMCFWFGPQMGWRLGWRSVLVGWHVELCYMLVKKCEYPQSKNQSVYFFPVLMENDLLVTLMNQKTLLFFLLKKNEHLKYLENLKKIQGCVSL